MDNINILLFSMILSCYLTIYTYCAYGRFDLIYLWLFLRGHITDIDQPYYPLLWKYVLSTFFFVQCLRIAIGFATYTIRIVFKRFIRTAATIIHNITTNSLSILSLLLLKKQQINIVNHCCAEVTNKCQ